MKLTVGAEAGRPLRYTRLPEQTSQGGRRPSLTPPGALYYGYGGGNLDPPRLLAWAHSSTTQALAGASCPPADPLPALLCWVQDGS